MTSEYITDVCIDMPHGMMCTQDRPAPGCSSCLQVNWASLIHIQWACVGFATWLLLIYLPVRMPLDRNLIPRYGPPRLTQPAVLQLTLKLMWSFVCRSYRPSPLPNSSQATITSSATAARVLYIFSLSAADTCMLTLACSTSNGSQQTGKATPKPERCCFPNSKEVLAVQQHACGHPRVLRSLP